jgi:hypothetical protein
MNTRNNTEITHRPPPSTDKLHPYVYGAIGIAVLWFALAVWGFRGDGYADYLFAIVTGFIVMAVSVPCILWHVGKKHESATGSHENDAARHSKISFRDWASADFVISQDRLKGANAAIEALLPLVVAAFGLTIFGIVFHLAAHHAA